MTEVPHIVLGRHLHHRTCPDYSTGVNPISDDYAIPYKPVDCWPYAGLLVR